MKLKINENNLIIKTAKTLYSNSPVIINKKSFLFKNSLPFTLEKTKKEKLTPNVPVKHV